MSQVLLADDDQELRSVVQILLVDAGHDVMTAGNGVEAIQAALAVVPQVIVTDVRMPVLDGRVAVSVLRSIPGFPEVPVVFMSGEAPGDAPGRGDRFIRKPFDPALLVDTVARMLQGPDDEGTAGGAGSRLLTAHAERRYCCGREPGTDPVMRALTLIRDQDRRVARLQSLGADPALAAEVQQSLINSFVVLAGFQRYIEPWVASKGHQGLPLLAADTAGG